MVHMFQINEPLNTFLGGSFQSKIVLFKDCGSLPAQKRRNSTMAVPSASAGFARTRFATWSQNVRYGFLRSIRSIAKIGSAGGYLNQWEESAGNDHKRRDSRIVIKLYHPISQWYNTSSNSEWIIQTTSGSLPN